MRKRSHSPPLRVPPWAAAVIISTLWTPEQALAVFDLLDTLRDKVWSLYGPRIQALLRDEQSSGDIVAHPDRIPRDGPSF